jgi:hypothetical protein
MKKLLVILILVIIAGNLEAQEKKFTFRLSDILFRDLVDTLEKRIGVTIFYSNKWTDSLYIDADARNE